MMRYDERSCVCNNKNQTNAIKYDKNVLGWYLSMSVCVYAIAMSKLNMHSF